MKFEKSHIIGLIISVVIIALSIIFLRNDSLFYFVLGIAFVIGGLPFVISLMAESRRERENNTMFLEFSRNLAESVKAGTSISKSIVNVKSKYYGSLTPHIQKLANQISIGIPVKYALNTFADDVNSKTVKRAITLISEADKAGGKIERILDSVANSVAEIEKLKKERMAAIYGLVVQGYIIFLIFIVIMLVLEFKILPMTSEFGELGTDSALFGTGIGTSSFNVEELSKPFLYLLLVQGLFAGLVIGKLAEGSIKSGIKHSFIMMVLVLLITTGARIFL